MKEKWQKKLAVISWLVIIILIFLFLANQIIAYQSRILLGVKILNQNLSLKTKEQAETILREKWAGFSTEAIELDYQNQAIRTNLKELGFGFDLQANVKQACQYGRRGSFAHRFKEQFLGFFNLAQLKPIYRLDQKQFQNKTSQLFQEIEKPAQNASLVFEASQPDFRIKPAKSGWLIDRKKMLAGLFQSIRSFRHQPIKLILIPDNPLVEDNETESARQAAKELLKNQPYQLFFQNHSWTIKQEILLDWLEFTPVKQNSSNNYILGLSLNQDKIKEYLQAEVAPVINQPALDAQLEIKDNRAIVFRPDQTGLEVKKEETAQALTNRLLQQQLAKTAIVVQKKAPRITLSQTNALGINSLIGQGISDFSGSPPNRIHNIKLGASKFNGLILKPNEEFSFNAILGQPGPDQNYLQELVIKRGEVIPEYGGGLCQVSTTAFRAAVNSGLKITERVPHSFPVVYYNPQGFDATIYNPHPDLRFINNTPNHLLIETKVEKNKLIFNFYGTDDGRQVKIKGPYILEKKPDGSMKTVLTQEVYQANKLIEKKVFYSSYQSPDLFTHPEKENKKTENNSADGGI